MGDALRSSTSETAHNMSHAAAIDVLSTSLRKALENPLSEKYRRVNVTNPVFRATVGSASGGTELLFAAGYEPMHGYLVSQGLDRHRLPLLEFAIAELERVKTTPAYCIARASAQLEAEAKAKAAKAAEEAKKRRAEYLARVPKEACDGATSCCELSIQIDGVKIASRRFDSEATLRDLIHFVRSLERVPEGKLRLENVTMAPVDTLNKTEADLERSLYSLDLWPVSHIRVSPEVCATA